MMVGGGTGKVVAWTGMTGMKWKWEQPWKNECGKRKEWKGQNAKEEETGSQQL